MGLGPFPTLGLHLRRDGAQLFQGELVEQGRVLEIAAAILGEQVAEDHAAGLLVGFGADEHRPPVGGRDVAGGQVTPDDPWLLVVG